MQNPLNIRYREFYDFPRMFVADLPGYSVLFDGSFDDTLDDYPPEYTLYLLPPLRDDELGGSWAHLADRATKSLGRIPTASVVFDATRRKSIDGSVLDRFFTRHAG